MHASACHRRRATLHAWYAAAIAGAQPGPAVAAALASVPAPAGGVHVLAIGKAAHGMAQAAVDAVRARGLTLGGGLVVAHHDAATPDAVLGVVVGDHPVPGARSARAAERLAMTVRAVGAWDLVVVLLSGGASSLVGASVDPATIAMDEIAECSRVLLASGAPIDVVNAVRKRISRWGAGRLARALAAQALAAQALAAQALAAQALTPLRVLCLAVSDVPGDDPAVIGSGPCAPDPWTRAALRDALVARDLLARLPASVRHYLGAAVGGETPKPGDAIFAGVALHVVRTNADARRAAAGAARSGGYTVVEHPAWLEGEASACGAAIARAMLATPAGHGHVWGGEPTVTLVHTPASAAPARGGRMQELALAAARVLHEAGAAADGLALLAGGTDGRDGPTTAAGACVDGTTWSAMEAAGRDPAAALAAHRSYDALGAVGALLPTAPTGTNVADVVIALRDR